MAIATAVSAAAMAMPNRLKKCPSRCPGKRYLLNTAKLMFVALSIQQVLACEETVYSAEQHHCTYHEIVYNVYFYFHNPLFLVSFSCNHNSSYHAGQQQHAHDLERQYELILFCSDEGLADILHRQLHTLRDDVQRKAVCSD